MVSADIVNEMLLSKVGNLKAESRKVMLGDRNKKAGMLLHRNQNILGLPYLMNFFDSIATGIKTAALKLVTVEYASPSVRRCCACLSYRLARITKKEVIEASSIGGFAAVPRSSFRACQGRPGHALR